MLSDWVIDDLGLSDEELQQVANDDRVAWLAANGDTFSEDAFWELRLYFAKRVSERTRFLVVATEKDFLMRDIANERKVKELWVASEDGIELLERSWEDFDGFLTHEEAPAPDFFPDGLEGSWESVIPDDL
ncbi:MAG: hypothetical protein AAF483_14380 [Planctomycetota bacterium]